MNHYPHWFFDIQETSSSAVSIATALQITEIATGSPAEALKLLPGDFLLSVNEKTALTANIVDILIKGGEVVYQFYQPQKDIVLTVRTPALPLGLRTEATSDGIVEQYKKGRTGWDADGIIKLWEREDYVHLRHVANTRSGGFFAKLFGKQTANPISNLLHAILDIETGDKAIGYATLEAFRRQSLSRFTRDVHGLVWYYDARRLVNTEGVDPVELRNKIWDLIDVLPNSARVGALAEKHEVDGPKTNLRLGSAYEFDLRMNCLEGRTKETSVPEAVSALSAGQVQPICFMVTYRGNGPYDDNIKVYRTVYPHLKDIMAPLFVITSEGTKRSDRPHWFEAEEALIKASLPITVAHDPTRAFADRFLSGAPEYIAVNDKGVVVWDQSLKDDFDYWELVSRASANQVFPPTRAKTDDGIS